MNGLRADVYLVKNGYASSRTEAQGAIAAGKVAVDGKKVLKPSQTIKGDVTIAYEKAHPYVSRGALKLLAALDQFGLSPEGHACIDVGASTGGFTEVLLERGARKVYAVDVGHGQLRGKLSGDLRVVSLEGVDARDLNESHIPEPVDGIVADVSFISLKLVLASALRFAHSGAFLVALVKPQFEAGHEFVGKGGIVSDVEAQEYVLAAVSEWIGSLPGWDVLGTMESPIRGGGGNREFLIAAKKS